MLTTLWIVIFGFVMGAVMGSFGLVLLDRWENLKSMITGRSMCLSCKHPLAIKDLVPLCSYLSTGGACRYCGVKIPVSCPLMELVMWTIRALTARWITTIWGDNLMISLIAWWMINWALTLMVVHDHNTHYLHWVAWITACIVAVWYTFGWYGDILMTSMWSSAILGTVFLLIYGSGFMVHWIKYWTRQEWFWFGDVLTALLIWWIAPLALWYDILNMIGEWGILTLVQLVLWYLVASSTIGLLYWWYLWSRGDQEIEVAFIPGMVIWFWIYAAIIVQFWLFIS